MMALEGHTANSLRAKGLTRRDQQKDNRASKIKWRRIAKESVIAATLTCTLPTPLPLDAQDIFAKLPPAAQPALVGEALARHFVTSPHQYAKPTLHYAEVVTWYGALRFAAVTHNNALRDDLIARFRPLLPEGTELERIPRRPHVDNSVFGVIPLEIAAQTHDAQMLAYGLSYADRQWQNTAPNALSPETRFWIDDMYMITLLQVEAFRATGQQMYLDRAAHEMLVYLGRLQQTSGLFYHSLDTPLYWGRGNGWVAAGMTELLMNLPPTHPDRRPILNAYKRMMKTLLTLEGKDGMWRQLLDRSDAWPESSASAMFTFAMIRGVQQGWLDRERFVPAARRAWIALTGYLDQNGDMTQVCEGTNKLNDANYYLSRRRLTGDFHGQGPMLWITSALLAP